MNISSLVAVALGIMGMSLVVRGKIQGRPGQKWVWYACGVLLIIGGAAYGITTGR